MLGVFLNMRVLRKLTQPLQGRIAEGIHFCMRNRFNIGEALTQDSEMSEAVDATAPNYLCTVLVIESSEFS